MNLKKNISIPLPTIRRLPLYVPLIKQAIVQGQSTISSSKIAEQLKLEPIQVRKDLASIGINGQARIGFKADELLGAIEHCLGWDKVSDAIIIGAGHLGIALAGYKGFENNGLKIIAMFDNDPNKTNTIVNNKKILHMNKLANLVSRMHIKIAILTVPQSAAQEVADFCVISGIKAIWNFTSTKLLVPAGIVVERVDLAASIGVLSNKLKTVLQQTK